ncbi:MAG TPA: S-layer homology domain-containing protein, partial [Planococcus sp. (in: firmicutes)]|nr:S-layer homology domain-containing protein [Planococcus sp. (in: firmicutes)]
MRFVSVFAAVVLMLSVLTAPASVASHSNSDSKYSEEIQYLVDRDIATLDKDGSFRAHKKISRAEAAVMIGKLKGLDGTPKDTGFRDVHKRDRSSGYIAAVVEAGYMEAYRGDSFRPNMKLSRSDTAILLSRVFDLAFSFNHQLRDVPEDHPAYEAIGKMMAGNFMIGRADGSFRPDKRVSRGEFAAYVARGLEPAFKNDVRIEHSYMKDKTKAYTYRMNDGTTATHRYVDVPNRGDLVYGFMWFGETSDGYTFEYAELETYNLFAIGYPYSEYDTLLVYPLEVGTSFRGGYEDSPLRTVTAVGVTVETEYATFENAT